jgi:heat shock protein HslJ
MLALGDALSATSFLYYVAVAWLSANWHSPEQDTRYREKIMKFFPLLIILTALLPVSGAVYAAEEPAQGGDPSSHASVDAGLLQTLQQHQWTLTVATDGADRRIDALFPVSARPYAFTFTESTLNVQGACNSFGGSYRINAQGQLEASQMRSTMMACDPPLMQADKALVALLAQPLELQISADTPPRLQLRTQSNETLGLEGQATPEALYGPATIIFIEVDARQLPCRNPRNGQTTCLQVRTVYFNEQGLRTAPPGPWQPLYDTIEGYTHTPGERNVLRVKRFDRGAAPGDAAQAVYVLDLIVSTETVPR